MRFLITVAVDAVAVWLAVLLVPGLSATYGGDGSTADQLITFAVIGLILALVNAVIKPVVKFFAFPLYLLTFGLFAFVVNAFMLQITSWISDFTPLSFHVDAFFWSAVLGAVVVTLATMVLNAVLGRD